MLCMLPIVSRILQSVEYLDSSSCRHLLPLYVLSFTSCPLALRLHPMAPMMSDLWCRGRPFSLVGAGLGLWLGIVILLRHLAFLLVRALGIVG